MLWGSERCGFFCTAKLITSSGLFGFSANKIKLRCGLKYALTGFCLQFRNAISFRRTAHADLSYVQRRYRGVSWYSGAFSLKLLSFVTVTVLLAVAGLAFQHELIFSLGNVKYLLLLGVGLNVTVAVLLIFAIFSPKAIGFLASALIRAVSAFSREKAESLREMTERQLAEYGQSAGYFKKNKLIFVKTLVTTTVQMFSMYGCSVSGLPGIRL